jgi:hypothetical protein
MVQETARGDVSLSVRPEVAIDLYLWRWDMLTSRPHDLIEMGTVGAVVLTLHARVAASLDGAASNTLSRQRSHD